MPLARIQQRLQELENWALEGGNMIMKEYQFPSFEKAMEFAVEVAKVAIEKNHHPAIMIDYTMVRLTLTTHDEGALTDKDFVVAAAIDKIGKNDN